MKNIYTKLDNFISEASNMNAQIVEQLLKDGVQLFEFKSFVNPNASLNSKIVRGKEYKSYKLSNGEKVHYKVIESMLKNKTIMRGDQTKTLGGYRIELKLA